jgi:predicted PurR-regulated permease PerM
MEDDRALRQRELRRTLVDNAISLGLIAIVIALAYQIFAPLFPALLWGLLLVVICAHPYERLVSRLHGRRAIADVAFSVLFLLSSCCRRSSSHGS